MGRSRLIASWDVAKGQVCVPYLAPTRNETDFAHHIADLIAQDPKAGWIFILAQLNTSVIRIPGTSGGNSGSNFPRLG